MWLRNTDEHITQSAVREWRLPLFEPGTVLLAMYGSIGTVSIAEVPTTANQAILGISPGDRLDAVYLWFFLRHRSPDIARLGRGGTQSNINAPIVRDLQLPLPPVDEQRRLSHALIDQLAAADQLRRKMSTAAELAALRAQVRRVSFDLVRAPRVVLGRVLTANGAIIDGPFGSNLKGDHYQTHGVRVIRLGNIGMGSFIDSDQAYVSESHFERLVRHAAIPGDVVVAALGDGARPAGRACLVPDDLAISMVKADCFRVRTSGSPLRGEYLVQYLNSPAVLAKLATASRGATRPRVTLEILRSLEIPLPSAEEQERAAKDIRVRLRTTDVLESAMSAELNAIEALPAALLRRAFADVAA